jgi:predicted molibdopterin-dependent oxidoreductase YjgC
MSTSAVQQPDMHREIIALTIDGQACAVPAGTSVAAALELAALQSPATGPRAAGGVARRSVQGMPRGPFCGMGICQECRVAIDGRPHRLACQILCAAGMVVVTSAMAAEPVHQA